MKLFLRLIHFLIVIYLFFGIGIIYYSAITMRLGILLYIALISLTIEGALIYFNKGNCPFGYIQRHYGDNVPFFELILPKKYAKKAVKICALITLIGMGLILIRLGLGR